MDEGLAGLRPARRRDGRGFGVGRGWGVVGQSDAEGAAVRAQMAAQGGGLGEERVESGRQGKRVIRECTGERAVKGCVSEGEAFRLCLHELQCK